MAETRGSVLRRTAVLLTALSAAVATAAAYGPVAVAQPQQIAAADGTVRTVQSDDYAAPIAKQQQKERQAALQDVLSGKRTVQTVHGSKVVRLGKGKYAELAREKTDKIFTVLVEFGDKVDNTTLYNGKVKYGGTPGPLHNRIEPPDRSVDNTTSWLADFNQQHYQDMYFSGSKPSLKTYYEAQSSGRYSVDGSVSDWVKVDWNEARYGSDYCGSHVCANAYQLIADGVNAWAAQQKAAGRTTAEIKATLAQYDQWDRYDYDHDGDFNEPDGYIDHFQIVHAGVDESAGGGVQGTDALWAHRSYAFASQAGVTGPEGNLLGGTQVGDTGVWVGDYTMQAENGGLGVFAHEYGHDLGLPDLYDTAGGDNSTGFWSIMSSGSWLGTGGSEIGDRPDDLDAWSKLQLGWLNYTTAQAGSKKTVKLNLSEYNSDQGQGLVVNLPDKKVTTDITTPGQGSTQWWSGTGDSRTATLAREIDLSGVSGAAAVSLDGWWDTEPDYDYVYAEVSKDGGANWTVVDGTADGGPLSTDGAGKPALNGASDSHRQLVYPLDGYVGQKIQFRFRYTTDTAVHGLGFAADRITVTGGGSTLFSDDAETEAAGWTSSGFSRVGASITTAYPEYYIVENRQYVSYDATLKTGPYQFGWLDTKADWVEHYPYQNGVQVWLWDTSQTDNNTSQHPGEGLALPVDAHPQPTVWSGTDILMNHRLQAYDATFGLAPTASLAVHRYGVTTVVPSQQGVSVFDDHKGSYWSANDPWGSVKVPDTGTRITVEKFSKDGSSVWLKLSPSQS
ncbi:immune inhibitor A domain-containing protein [Streptacidiphilus monticola]|uniref:Immune inhibitor A domain-containing protein n=1 Tax=Streptacidiphilus monticola TaxID=2161674 RepID=A0ABW1G769_9ACTN